MAKTQKIYLPEDAQLSGIDITYIKSTKSLRIGGWYDGMIRISGGEMHLAKFFSNLGITEKDCKQAFALSNLREFNK